MSYDTIRINELAKELKITNKELLEKLAKISIVGKTHSSTLTPEQVKKIKDFILNGEKTSKPSKPKAFIVKKSKEVSVMEAEKPASKADTHPVPRIERVERVPRIEIVKKKEAPVQVIEKSATEPKKQTEVAVETKAVKEKTEIPKTKIEIVKPKSRLEIVRRAPRPSQDDDTAKSEKTKPSKDPFGVLNSF